jgi:hypothetical protein
VACCFFAAGYFQDNIVTHLVAGLGAGFFAVCVGSPVDVVKSRVMGECAVTPVATRRVHAAPQVLWLSSQKLGV